MRPTEPDDPWGERRVERVLRRIPPFDCDDALRRKTIACGEIKKFQAGEVLIQQGASDRGLYLLLCGEVDVHVNDRHVAVRTAGTHVGEMAAVNPRATRSARVTAREPVVTLALECEDVEDLADAHPRLWRAFASELAHRLERRGKVEQRSRPDPTAQPPGPALLLAPDTIADLRNLATGTPLADRARRDTLLGGIPQSVVDQLPHHEALDAQLRSDLQHLSNEPALEDGLVPLRAWLLNAIPLCSGTLRTRLEAALREMEMVLAARAGRPEPDRRERIIVRDDMLPASFARRMLEVASAVVHLTVACHRAGVPGGKSYGTGWIAAPRLMLTAFHVVSCRKPGEVLDQSDRDRQVASTELRFGYDGEEMPVPAPERVSLLHWDETLDYAVLRLTTPAPVPPLRVASGPVELSPAIGHALNIIQHPGGGPKKLGIRNNLLYDCKPDTLQYFTDTLEGSSGAPVLDDRWRVVGLHHSWERTERLIDFHGEKTAYVNQGTRIDRILQHLRAHRPDLADEIASAHAANQPEPA